MEVMHEVCIVHYSVSGKCGRGRGSGGKRGEEVKKGGERRSKEKKMSWGRERKVEQERAKQIDI
jgi:hypothetical protein